MELDTPATVDMTLIQGCCQEAERATIVHYTLSALRDALPVNFHAHMDGLREEIRTSSQLLRELADRSRVYYSRIPVVVDYLNVVLPCLCKSLRDITQYYEDKTVKKEIRWRKMYNEMTEEAAGLPLPQRFALYNVFLVMLIQLLTRLVLPSL